MKNVKDITVCVRDHGQFVAIARRIGEQVAKCYYSTPTEKSMKMFEDAVIGEGFPEIERIDKDKDIWDIKDECDMFVYPDIGFASEQRELLRQGIPVWGARGLDDIESNRGLFLRLLDGLGMKVPPFEMVNGLTNLKLYLKPKEDKYIKISYWRGNMETFHWTNWKEGEGELDQLAVTFGPTKEHITFYVFDPIPTDIEDAIDAYCIDSEFPSLVLHGMENKDKSFIGCMTEWDKLPKETRSINEQFAPALSDYRGFFGTEVRITDDGESYFIDPTCRAGSPPHQMMTELFDNYADILWQGANGNCINPEISNKFGVQALLTSSQGKDESASFVVNEALDEKMKFGFCYKLDGRIIFPPHQLGNICGYLIGTGNTIKDAIDDLKESVKQLPSGLKCEDKSIADLLLEIQSAEDSGMEFTAQTIPEPAEVLS